MEKRIIKFRGWDGYSMDTSFWIGGDGTQSGISLDLNLYENLKGVTLLQFTGLHDKNGKEIYEGDIVRFQAIGGMESEVGEVIFENAEYFIRIGATRTYGLYRGIFSNCEIIGNIYENPELLK